MGCALQRHVDQVSQGELGSAYVEMTSREPPSQHGGDLEVDQLRGGHLLASEPGPGPVPIASVVSQCDRKHACVNDEHARTSRCSPLP